MRLLRSLTRPALAGLLTAAATLVHAQGWQLIWSDEFNGSIGPSWVFETGAGGWQNWTTISHTVNINAGTYNVGVFAQQGGWNLNWIRFTKI